MKSPQPNALNLMDFILWPRKLLHSYAVSGLGKVSFAMKKSTIMLLVSVLAYAMGSHAAPPPANQVLTDALRCGAGNATRHSKNR